ncbi:hypothetical protein FMUBM48_54030 [Nocardia cyriacigeorgica]|nr:hypothetical protein FMUBM48_54030 [Nocardia cyriacigeorgica]
MTFGLAMPVTWNTAWVRPGRLGRPLVPLSTGIGLMAFGFAVAGVVAVRSRAEAPASADIRRDAVLRTGSGLRGRAEMGLDPRNARVCRAPHFDWLANRRKC